MYSNIFVLFNIIPFEKGASEIWAATIFSSIVILLFNPLTFLSSGICDNPAFLIFFTDSLVIFFPSKSMLPFSTLRNPQIASINSLCPLPSIPAIPTISPDLTSSETPLILDISFSPEVHRLSIFSTVSPIWACFFSIFKKTSLPTIIFASSA